MNQGLDLIARLHQEDPWDDSLEPQLKEAGFEYPEKAWNILLDIRRHSQFPELYPGFFPEFLNCLSNSFLPDVALNNFESLSLKIHDKEHLYSQLTASPGFLEILVTLFSGSQVLTDVLLKNPTHLDWLSQPETLSRKKTRDMLYREFYEFAEDYQLPQDTPVLLRRFKQREYIRIGLRDLMGRVSLQENVRSLSDLADVCLQIAYDFANLTLKLKHGIPRYENESGQKLDSEFAILSMGKLGGRELNYSSDIDLIYIYTSSQGNTEGEGTQSISNHEYHTRLGQLITKTIHEITEEGNVFRVDLDLRPQGKSGEIVNSLERCEIYYESWGRTWERQALIKARVSAGSEALGQMFFEMITPFIFRKSLDFSALKEIKALKLKVDQDLVKKKKEKGHIKLGPGGIREIEFIVQSYQLLFGGRDNSLRDTGTLPTLDKLGERKFLSEDEYTRLKEAYIFLRNLENRVQISFGLQAYHIPTDESQLASLARKMNIRASSRQESIDLLMAEFEKHTGFVRKLYEHLFSEDRDKEAEQQALRQWDARRALEAKFSPDLMQNFRFHDPDRAYRFLKSLMEGPGEIPASERMLQKVFAVLPDILDGCAQVPDPNRAVENLVRFLEASKALESLLDLFHGQVNILKLLLILFGSSDVLSSILIRQPGLFDLMLNPEFLYRLKTPSRMKNEMDARLKDSTSFEESQEAVRQFKFGEELRIGIRYLIRETDLPSTLEDLSNLADVVLGAALEVSEKEIAKDKTYGSVPSGQLAIMALGKLGGHELNFGSDLDIVFVYDEGDQNDPEVSGGDAMAYYSAICQKLVSLCSGVTPSGIAYKVDTDLRPEGSRGALVMSLKGYDDYYNSRGQVWEQQAMIRTRFVAGNSQVGERFLKISHGFTFRKKLEYGSLIEVARLRERMQKELAKETDDSRNVKLGRGGLADIEFAVQIMQLMHGKRYPQMRNTNTLISLDFLDSLGLMDGAEVAIISGHYLFLRNLECALRLVSETASSHIPKEPKDRAVLARLLDYQASDCDQQLADSLWKDYQQVTQEVHSFYRKTMDNLLRTSL